MRRTVDLRASDEAQGEGPGDRVFDAGGIQDLVLVHGNDRASLGVTLAVVHPKFTVAPQDGQNLTPEPLAELRSRGLRLHRNRTHLLQEIGFRLAVAQNHKPGAAALRIEVRLGFHDRKLPQFVRLVQDLPGEGDVSEDPFVVVREDDGIHRGKAVLDVGPHRGRLDVGGRVGDLVVQPEQGRGPVGGHHADLQRRGPVVHGKDSAGLDARLVATPPEPVGGVVVTDQSAQIDLGPEGVQVMRHVRRAAQGVIFPDGLEDGRGRRHGRDDPRPDVLVGHEVSNDQDAALLKAIQQTAEFCHGCAPSRKRHPLPADRRMR